MDYGPRQGPFAHRAGFLGFSDRDGFSQSPFMYLGLCFSVGGVGDSEWECNKL